MEPARSAFVRKFPAARGEFSEAARVTGFWETFDVSQNRRPVNYIRLCFGALLPVAGGSLFPPCLLGVLPCPPINHPRASITPALVGRTNALTLNPTPCAGETAAFLPVASLPAQASRASPLRLVPSAPCALRVPCGHARAQATHKPSGEITFDFEQVPQKKRTRGCSPFFEKTGGEKTFLISSGVKHTRFKKAHTETAL